MEELELNGTQNLILADLNAVDLEDYRRKNLTPVKDNDIRVIRLRSLIDCLNSYLLCDLAKNQEEIQFTSFIMIKGLKAIAALTIALAIWNL